MKRFASVLAVLLCVVLLSSCWRDPHGYFGEDSTELSRARYAQIVDALDRHDAASLKTMFTKSALADHSAELDAGVAYLLLLFPNGDIATKETNNIPASEYRRIDDDHRAILVRTMYRISSGGEGLLAVLRRFHHQHDRSDQRGHLRVGS